MIVGGFSIYQYHTFTSYQQLCSVRSLKKSIVWVFTSTYVEARDCTCTSLSHGRSRFDEFSESRSR